jgi:hypothetical protein
MQSLAFTGGIAEAAQADNSIEALRQVSLAHGSNLTDDRLRVIKPAVEAKLAALRALREAKVDDAVEPR